MKKLLTLAVALALLVPVSMSGAAFADSFESSYYYRAKQLYVVSIKVDREDNIQNAVNKWLEDNPEAKVKSMDYQFGYNYQAVLITVLK